MFPVDRLILITAVLVLAGVASSKFSARLGLPVLLVFLGVGMLAGSEGIGGIDFEDFQLAHGVASIALALILFDGGLQTPLSSFRAGLAPAVVLATIGVVLTAAVTGVVAAVILDTSWLEGLLIGSIVGSTDAAAVFAVLRSQGVRIRERLAATLEVESGSNDPMAIFLTVACIELLLGRTEPGFGLLWLFVRQMVLGAFFGVVLALGVVWVINRVNLSAAGLYPVFVGAGGLLAYGLTAALGGSGFLAVYLAGLVIGNSRIVFRRGIHVFHDALAWLSQIGLFVMLGLLSFPSQLADVAWQGLLIAGVLVFLARPIAVVACLAPFRFRRREVAFISWVGLKGAVPIVLATYPLFFGLPNAWLAFNVVFFAVLISAAFQGWTMPPLARYLKLTLPPRPEPPATLEIAALRAVDSEIVEYQVDAKSRAAGRRIRDLALPDGAVVALVARGRQVIPPQGDTEIRAGDHVSVVLRSEVQPLVDRIFAEATEEQAAPAEVEFALRGTATVGEIQAMYGIAVDAPPDKTLDALLREWLGDDLEPGHEVTIGNVALRVQAVLDGRVTRVGLAILPEPDERTAAGADSTRSRPGRTGAGGGAGADVAASAPTGAHTGTEPPPSVERPAPAEPAAPAPAPAPAAPGARRAPTAPEDR